MGVYDEVTEEVTETETPVAEEENVKEDQYGNNYRRRDNNR